MPNFSLLFEACWFVTWSFLISSAMLPSDSNRYEVIYSKNLLVNPNNSILSLWCSGLFIFFIWIPNIILTYRRTSGKWLVDCEMHIFVSLWGHGLICIFIKVFFPGWFSSIFRAKQMCRDNLSKVKCTSDTCWNIYLI